jgi:hypothetical protein
MNLNPPIPLEDENGVVPEKWPEPIWINVTHEEYESMMSKCSIVPITEQIILKELEMLNDEEFEKVESAQKSLHKYLECLYSTPDVAPFYVGIAMTTLIQIIDARGKKEKAND